MREPELIQALTDPRAYRPSPETVETLQTHASIIFFAGNLVYKVKKSVDLGFLDFSTLDKRRFYCQEEVRLNRRLAPQTYRGVVNVTRTDEGGLRVNGDGEIVEHAVEMERLPADRMLAALLERGEADTALIDQIAEILVRFHAGAASGPDVDAHATPDAVRRKTIGNLDAAEPFAGDLPDQPAPDEPTLTRAAWRRLRNWTQRRLGDHRDVMRKRVTEGRAREGHGDLHAGNICALPDRIVIYDCIEFEPAFRCCDVAADIAFLAMDLDRRGAPSLADGLIDTYSTEAHDDGLRALQPLYRCHFAAVRGKVDSIKARETEVDDEQRRAAWTSACGAFSLALGYTLPACLIVMCGPPGSGKSVVASAVARPLRADVVRSDVLRKSLGGYRPTDRPDPDVIYTPEFTRRTYEAMRAQAADVLAKGRSVVLDATFATRSMRDSAFQLGRERGAPAALIEVQAPDAVIEERLRRRAHDAAEPSDADVAVFREAKDASEPPEEIERDRRIAATPDIRLEVVASRVLNALAAQSPP